MLHALRWVKTQSYRYKLHDFRARQSTHVALAVHLARPHAIGGQGEGPSTARYHSSVLPSNIPWQMHEIRNISAAQETQGGGPSPISEPGSGRGGEDDPVSGAICESVRIISDTV